MDREEMYIKTLICFANSRKPPSGRCIAGKEFVEDGPGEWIRPVSSREGHEVSEEERRYNNGTKAKLLDIISIPMERANPQGHQIENHILNDKYYWTKIGVASWEQVTQAVDDDDDDLFWSFSNSTYHGTSDKVAAEKVNLIGSSLRLIRVNNLEIKVITEDGYQGEPSRRRVRASFNVKGSEYLLSVTDPEIEERYLAQSDGAYLIGDAVLCISLVEVWNGYAFRVVASVITPDRCDT
jgi:hypothetical protein